MAMVLYDGPSSLIVLVLVWLTANIEWCEDERRWVV